MTTIAERLEELRAMIRAEDISYGELAELQGLADHIHPSDVELLEWAGVEESHAFADWAEIHAEPSEWAERKGY